MEGSSKEVKEDDKAKIFSGVCWPTNQTLCPEESSDDRFSNPKLSNIRQKKPEELEEY